ncbi:MAG: F0F1 ATP synthase subunit B [Patescibacteria group bacterium]|nr:F0F1 ATP synthase subunit B [Patescibacteria group bacterium]
MTPESVQAATEAAQAGAFSSVLSSLGVDWQLFIAQLINFAIVIFVLWKWAYKPLMIKMDERSKKIEDGLQFSKEADERLKSAVEENERIINEAKAQSHMFIEEARDKAEKVRQDKIRLTNQDMERVIADAKQQIEVERQGTFTALREDIADLVTAATNKVAEKIDENTKRSLISEALREIEQSKG